MNLRATYRLQFNASFGFADAAKIAPYLAELGVSHIYASPIFAARPGSTHGYDVTDPNAFNPELGGEAGFRAMAEVLRANDLGLILDIVPNHMGIGGASNRFWLDVLEWGEESPFAGWFDIDWRASYPGLHGKVLVPFLGAPYGDVLADGGLKLRFDGSAGAFAVWAHDAHKLPICPRTYAGVLRAGGLDTLAAQVESAAGLKSADPAWDRLRKELASAPEEAIASALAAFAGSAGDPASWSRLDALIAEQHWRAAKFNLDGDAINYRRFFTISDLAGVRVEHPDVFDATHRLILSLLEEGLISGVRIDHIDGLRDPKGYSLRLRERAARPFSLHVEKILAADEELPSSWQTDGTTGYEFANLLIGLLADPAGAETLTETYAEFTGRTDPPGEVAHAAKLEVMQGAMAAELEALVVRLLLLAARDPRRRDLGRGALRAGVAQVIAALDVYRTYADSDGMDESGRDRLDKAIGEARRRAPRIDPGVFDFLATVLTVDEGGDFASERDEVLDIAMRFQQFSGPVMAKGLEDAALYRFNRLIALNEVGGDAGAHVVSVEAFHQANAERLARYPRALLATSTHDTKRGEDARARIGALTSHAAAWSDFVRDAGMRLMRDAPDVDPNEGYFFLQLLLGAWPADQPPDRPLPPEMLRDLTARVQEGMVKSAREAGVNTRWVFGDAEYEDALKAMASRALDPDGAFLPAFRSFESVVAHEGAASSLIQTVLKLTVPGVPDLYQGAELWDQSLVDPDNRRPVDFDRRDELLANVREPGAQASGAALKLRAISTLLRLRRDKPALFDSGSYEPMLATGPAASGLCAFARRQGPDTLVVAAALHPSVTGASQLSESAFCVPDGVEGPYVDVLSGRTYPDLAPKTLFRDSRVVVLQARSEKSAQG